MQYDDRHFEYEETKAPTKPAAIGMHESWVMRDGILDLG